MMKSFNPLFPVIAIAIIGSLVMHLLSVPSFLAFSFGVLATAVFMTVNPNPISLPTRKTESEPSKTIYVGNLPYRANESDVKKLFADYGDVFAVRLMKDKRTGKRRGFGFVVMAGNDAEAAISALNNSDYGQRTLKVREANDPKGQEDSNE